MTLVRERPRRDRPLSCRKVGRLLQSALDDAVDDDLAGRVADHLEACRRCGLEAEFYRELKASLARRGRRLPETSVARLRRFGEQLAADGEPSP